jgi:hypothetical protein
VSGSRVAAEKIRANASPLKIVLVSAIDQAAEELTQKHD